MTSVVEVVVSAATSWAGCDTDDVAAVVETDCAKLSKDTEKTHKKPLIFQVSSYF